MQGTGRGGDESREWPIGAASVVRSLPSAAVLVGRVAREAGELFVFFTLEAQVVGPASLQVTLAQGFRFDRECHPELLPETAQYAPATPLTSTLLPMKAFCFGAGPVAKFDLPAGLPAGSYGFRIRVDNPDFPADYSVAQLELQEAGAVVQGEP